LRDASRRNASPFSEATTERSRDWPRHSVGTRGGIPIRRLGGRWATPTLHWGTVAGAEVIRESDNPFDQAPHHLPSPGPMRPNRRSAAIDQAESAGRTTRRFAGEDVRRERSARRQAERRLVHVRPVREADPNRRASRHQR
jgi:hypothetical protein